MAKPFSFGIVADVREFIRESGKVSDQLETIADGLEEMADTSDAAAKDAADSLDQIGDAADDAGKDIKDGIEDGAKDAEKVLDRQADDMEKSLDKVGEAGEQAGKDLASEVETGAKKAETSVKTESDRMRAALDKLRDKARDSGKAIGKEIGDGSDKASEALDEFNDEAASVGREAATSFTGELEDITDIVRDIAANAFVGFGPAGAAAGIAAAAGIGVIISAIDKSKERAEQAEERFESMVDALASGDADAFGDYVAEQMLAIVKGSDDAIASMDKVEDWFEILGDSGVTTADLLAALAGDQGAINRVRDAMEETANVSEIAWKKVNGVNLTPAEQAIADLDTVLRNQEESTIAAEEAAGAYEEAVEGTKDPIVQAKEAGREMVEVLKEEQEIRTALADANRNYAQVLADQDDELQAVQETIAENNELHTDAAQLAVENTAALADLADGLIDEATAAEEAGIAGDRLSEIQTQNYDDFMATAAAAGFTAEEARQLASDFGLIPDDTKTDIKTRGKDQAVIEIQDMKNQLAKIERNVDIKTSFKTGDLAGQIRRQVALMGTIQIPAVASIIGRTIR